MQNLFSAYHRLGRHEEAGDLARRVMNGRTSLLGPEHRATLDMASIIADRISKQERWEEALVLEERTMEGRKRVYGRDHPKTFNSMLRLVKYYEKTNRPQEAKDMEALVTEVTKSVRHNKSGMLSGTYLSGSVGWGNFNHDILIAVQNHGPDHPHTLQTMIRVAEKHYNLGELEEAEEMWLQALEKIKKVRGDNHSETLSAMKRLS